MYRIIYNWIILQFIRLGLRKKFDIFFASFFSR